MLLSVLASGRTACAEKGFWELPTRIIFEEMALPFFELLMQMAACPAIRLE